MCHSGSLPVMTERIKAEMQFRNLPSVDGVMAIPTVADLAAGYRHDLVVNLVRQQLDLARQEIRRGGPAPPAAELATAVARELESLARREPRRVINATGVIIHTNLGRAPLSRAATEAMV